MERAVRGGAEKARRREGEKKRRREGDEERGGDAALHLALCQRGLDERVADEDGLAVQVLRVEQVLARP